MCLIFLSYNQHPDYPFIAVANRDEFYDRPAKAIHFWPDHPGILAGKDLSGGGTWLGVTKKGYFSMLTNFRDIPNIKPNAPTRGKLVLDFLIGNHDSASYLQALNADSNRFNGYNILLGTLTDPWYYSNQNNTIYRLGTGSYGLSNALLDTDWPKVTEGKRNFNEIISQDDFKVDELFEMMLDRTEAPEEKLPDTGIGLEKEKSLSSRFIVMDGYGTRNTTVLLLDKNKRVMLKERTFNPIDQSFKDHEIDFTLKP